MLLLIPGPVTTRDEVRAAATRDFAPWDDEFRAFHARLRERVRRLAGGREEEHVAILLQGCGHFALEAAVRSFVPSGGRLLVPLTGAYGERLARLAREAGREVVPLEVPKAARVSPAALEAALRADPSLGHVGLVYSETGTGVVHDVPALAALAGRLGRRVLVDGVSALGALPFDLGALPAVDAVVFTANKCVEGLPGLGIVVARTDRLRAAAGRAGSWSLDLADAYEVALREGPGVFRFTPPAQVVAALDRALDFWEAEGRAARLARYEANMRTLYDGVLTLGLAPCLPPELQGPVVVNVHAPQDPAWELRRFVAALKRRSVVISNFWNTPFPSFRVGCIGAVTPDDMRRAVAAIGEALDEIGVRRRRAG